MLGPLLLLVHIQDVTLVVSSAIGHFAYDTYIYPVIKSKEDGTTPQRNLDTLLKWEDLVKELPPQQMQGFAIKKEKKTIRFNHKIHKKYLKKVDCTKYLGFQIDKKNLQWKYHVSSITSKANHCRHFLQQELVTCARRTKLQCNKRFIRLVHCTKNEVFH